jgi:hypothetical protein
LKTGSANKGNLPFLLFCKKVDICIADLLLDCCGYVRISQVLKERRNREYSQFITTSVNVVISTNVEPY